MKTITYSEFIKKHTGKAMDFDGVAGSQCVDLIKYYLKEVFNINPGAWGDAHCYYDNYNNISALKNNFTRIANTPDFVPRKGDIVVWSPNLSSGGWGHVAIATGEGNTKEFYSYDQNWTGNHDACKMVKHNYNCVYGVLRPKDQTKITGVKKAENPFKKGNHTLTANVNVRTGAGTKHAIKKRTQLSLDGQAHAINQTYACLKVGTVVTVSEIKKISDKEYWGKIPSGWVALMYKGIKYVK